MPSQRTAAPNLSHLKDEKSRPMLVERLNPGLLGVLAAEFWSLDSYGSIIIISIPQFGRPVSDADFHTFSHLFSTSDFSKDNPEFKLQSSLHCLDLYFLKSRAHSTY